MEKRSRHVVASVFLIGWALHLLALPAIAELQITCRDTLPVVVPVGEAGSARFSVDGMDDPAPEGEITYRFDHYLWSLSPSDDGVASLTNAEGAETTFEAVSNSPFAREYTLSVVAVYFAYDNNGNRFPDADVQRGTKSIQVPFAAVGVKRIVQTTPTPPPGLETGPAVLFPGESITLRADRDPPPVDGAYPSGQPTWSITSKPNGSNMAAPPAGNASVSVTPDVAGQYVITAKCGNADGGASFTINVVRLRIVSVEFTTDHDLLKDKDDNYNDGGTRYPDIEWNIGGPGMPASNAPFTHTCNQKITAKVTIEVSAGGPNGNVDISGTGLGDFSTNNVALPAPGTRGDVTIQATNALENRILRREEPIEWTIRVAGGGAVLTSQKTGPHVVYQTLGTPRNTGDAKYTVTLKRIERAVATAGGATDANGNPSVDPHTLIRHIIQAQGAFDLAGAKANAWTVPDSPSDCQSIVRFCIKCGKYDQYTRDSGVQEDIRDRDRPRCGDRGRRGHGRWVEYPPTT